MPCDLTQRVSVPTEVLLQEVQGESVLLNLNTGRYFGLNAMGTVMWNTCTTSASLGDALAQLASQYDVDPAQLEQDLRSLMDKLVEHGLVSVAG